MSVPIGEWWERRPLTSKGFFMKVLADLVKEFELHLERNGSR